MPTGIGLGSGSGLAVKPKPRTTTDSLSTSIQASSCRKRPWEDRLCPTCKEWDSGLGAPRSMRTLARRNSSRFCGALPAALATARRSWFPGLPPRCVDCAELCPANSAACDVTPGRFGGGRPHGHRQFAKVADTAADGRFFALSPRCLVCLRMPLLRLSGAAGSLAEPPGPRVSQLALTARRSCRDSSPPRVCGDSRFWQRPD